jgi:3-carboxy-cis,cis-muconate cycloisomerase
MIHDHERDKIAWQIEWEALPETAIMTDAILVALTKILNGLHVNENMMRKNLMITNGLILSESVMLSLGEKIGKQKSHEIIYQTCMLSFEQDRPLSEVLLENQEVKQYISEQELIELLDPARYTGLAGEMVDKVVARTRSLRQPGHHSAPAL